MDDFYLFMASNANPDLYPDNTPADFHVKLPKTLNLNSNYEVGLVDILYVSSFYNVNDPDGYFMVEFKDSTKSLIVKLRGGDYTIKRLTETMNKLILENFPNTPSDAGDVVNKKDREYILKFGYDTSQNRIHFTYSGIKSVKFSTPFSNILGFQSKRINCKSNTGIHYAKYTTDQELGQYYFYLYSDLVDFSVTSNTESQILRVFEKQGSFGEIINKSFKNIVYAKIRKQEVDELHFQLKKDDNKLVDFLKGKTALTLHIRRRK